MPTYMEQKAAIEACYAEYRSTNFHNMSPMMIANMMRGGICRVLRSIDNMESEIRANAPSIHGRATQAQIENIDRLRTSAKAVWTHINNEIEKSIARAG